MRKKHVFLGVIALIVVVAAASLATNADRPRLKASENGTPSRIAIPTNLPPLDKLPQQISLEKATSVLQFDDGTCESGLGAGVTVTAWHEFDVPTQCVMGGLEVVAVTARMNTGFAFSGVLGQSGATPPPPFGGTFVSLTAAFSPLGGCQPTPDATTVFPRFPGGPGPVIMGTANFFFGLLNTGFLGRDTDGVPAGRMWLNCASCAMTQYSPTALSGLGLGGNFMLRVTVEDEDCVPIELEGACCTDGQGTASECIIAFEDDCEADGGTFVGEGITCDDFQPGDCTALFVNIADMSATPIRGGVSIQWTTSMEVDTVGFRVLREDIGGNREKTLVDVTGLVLSRSNGLGSGSEYEVEDLSRAALTSTVYYIQDLDTSGRTELHGPIIVDRGSRRASR